MEYYNYIKSLHLIFVITWFAGLFYIVRLFVYQIEADQKPSPEREILLAQYKIMTSRLWFIITWPSAVLALLFAIWLLVIMPSWLQMPWMHVKLGFVVLLICCSSSLEYCLLLGKASIGEVFELLSRKAASIGVSAWTLGNLGIESVFERVFQETHQTSMEVHVAIN